MTRSTIGYRDNDLITFYNGRYRECRTSHLGVMDALNLVLASRHMAVDTGHTYLTVLRLQPFCGGIFQRFPINQYTLITKLVTVNAYLMPRRRPAGIFAGIRMRSVYAAMAGLATNGFAIFQYIPIMLSCIKHWSMASQAILYLIILKQIELTYDAWT